MAGMSMPAQEFNAGIQILTWLLQSFDRCVRDQAKTSTRFTLPINTRSSAHTKRMARQLIPS